VQNRGKTRGWQGIRLHPDVKERLGAVQEGQEEKR
jgi:hypothetical protein